MTRRAPRPDAQQRGVALLTAILVVALASVAAVALVERSSRDINRTDMLLRVSRADTLQQGIAAWAIGQLQRDGADSDYDHPGEDWALPLPPTEVTGGTVEGQIYDLSGRFNLNNLILAPATRQGNDSSTTSDDTANDSGNTTGDKDQEDANNTKQVKVESDYQRFERLLSVLQIDTSVGDAILDWLDGDQQNHGPGGAEDLVYLGREPAYRSADRLFQDASELLLVQGMKREDYETLRPHISTLPRYTPININSATAPVLASLSDQLDLASAEALVTQTDTEAYKEVADFLSASGLDQHVDLTSVISVRSDWFIAQGLVTMGGLERHARFLLHRSALDDNLVQVQVVQLTRTRTQTRTQARTPN